MAAYDLFSVRGSTQTMWGLVALSLAAGEELGVLPVPLRRRAELVPRPALALGLVGLAGGFALAVSVPVTHSLDAVLTTVHPRAIATTERDNPYPNKVMAQTGCLLVDSLDTGATVDCRDVDRVPGGIGEIRIEAGDPATVRDAFASVRTSVSTAFPHATLQATGEGSGRPTWATTAPFWLFAVGFAVGALVPDHAYRPPPRVRARRPTTPDRAGAAGG
jgi:hypothetical protein